MRESSFTTNLIVVMIQNQQMIHLHKKLNVVNDDKFNPCAIQNDWFNRNKQKKNVEFQDGKWTIKYLSKSLINFSSEKLMVPVPKEMWSKHKLILFLSRTNAKYSIKKTKVDA